MNKKNWENEGEIIEEGDIDRWVCKHCGEDFPLDLNSDILPHLAEDHSIGDSLDID